MVYSGSRDIMQKNLDYVNYNPDMDTAIGFTIAGKAKTASEEYIEILEISKKVFDIIKNFYLPTYIGYRLYTYANEVPVYCLLPYNYKNDDEMKIMTDIAGGELADHFRKKVLFFSILNEITGINLVALAQNDPAETG